jgi:hypothetical protein
MVDICEAANHDPTGPITPPSIPRAISIATSTTMLLRRQTRRPRDNPAQVRDVLTDSRQFGEDAAYAVVVEHAALNRAVSRDHGREGMRASRAAGSPRLRDPAGSGCRYMSLSALRRVPTTSMAGRSR